ncbi:winged helix-turn-helix transcriptional regulator, partial [Salmonella enterica]|nr:winged helix-turn-helix transcriptional regulator [Salmonella enterica]
MAGEVQFDRTDIRLLAEIQRDGRATNAELAARVNLSPSACLRRLQRLESEGVIVGYGARLEPR